MKIFLDTANLESIKKFNDMGLLDGITTNPSLMSKEGGNPKNAMEEITKIIQGDVSLEVVSTEYSGMMEEGKRLREYGNNVVVKVPMTPDGLKACKSFSSQGIPVNVTLIFSANQALLAAKSGAKYVSPFIGRLDDIGQDGMNLIKEIKEIFSNYTFNTQILVASVRHPLHVIDAAKIGADVVTLPPGVLDKMLQHPLTKIGLDNFLADWEKLKQKILILRYKKSLKNIRKIKSKKEFMLYLFLNQYLCQYFLFCL